MINNDFILGFQIFSNHCIFCFFEYTISEQIACRSSWLEYDERVCLVSASDGVLQSVEYRLRVGRACQNVISFLERIIGHETGYNHHRTTQVQW